MLEKLILYFVIRTKGHITKTQLVKFLYLADLYSVKWTGQQLTDLEWCYYNHGPWNEEIDAALRLMEPIILEDQGLVTLVKLRKDGSMVKDIHLSDGLELMLENIRKEWAGAGNEKFEELMKYVYSTAPMVEAKRQSSPQDKAPLNLQLERDKLLAEIGG